MNKIGRVEQEANYYNASKTFTKVKDMKRFDVKTEQKHTKLGEKETKSSSSSIAPS